MVFCQAKSCTDARFGFQKMIGVTVYQQLGNSFNGTSNQYSFKFKLLPLELESFE